jgi:hypothetical protein
VSNSDLDAFIWESIGNSDEPSIVSIREREQRETFACFVFQGGDQ